MSWRCACFYSLPIFLVYAASFFMPAWQDGNTTYAGYETIGRGFDLANIKGETGTFTLLLLPNMIVCAGMILLALPQTWARIVASVLGLLALMISAQIMICIGFLSFLSGIITSMFGANTGPSGVREGFFFWIFSMFMLLMMGLITAIVSGTSASPDRRDDERRRRYRDDDDSDDYRRRPRYDDDDDLPRRPRDDDDEPFRRRGRSEGDGYRRDDD